MRTIAPGIWMIFMLFVILCAAIYTDKENELTKRMNAYESACFKYERMKKALTVASIIGVVTVPIFILVFSD